MALPILRKHSSVFKFQAKGGTFCTVRWGDVEDFVGPEAREFYFFPDRCTISKAASSEWDSAERLHQKGWTGWMSFVIDDYSFNTTALLFS